MKVRERLAAGFCVGAAVATAWVGWDQLGIRPLTQHVPQMYGAGDLGLAFLAAVVIWLCLHAAVTVRRSRSLAAVHGAALALAMGAFAYLHWPRGEADFGYFAYLSEAEPPHWGRDVTLLVGALVAGFALPTAVAVRRRRRSPPSC